MNTFNIIAGVASILSFFASIVALLGIWKVSEYYMRHRKLPGYTAKLNAHKKNAITALENKSFEELKLSLILWEETAQRTSNHVDKAAKERLKIARDTINNIIKKDNMLAATESEGLFSLFEVAIESVKSFTGEDKWKK